MNGEDEIMECREVEGLVQQYIDDTLPPKKLEAFISHVCHCPHCYEELETYFIIHHAIKYLDEDRHESYNMKAMLSDDLKIKAKKVQLHNRMRMAATYVAILLGILLFGLAGMLLFPDNFVMSLFENAV